MKRNYYQNLIINFLFIIFLLLGNNFNILNQNQNLNKPKTNQTTNEYKFKSVNQILVTNYKDENNFTFKIKNVDEKQLEQGFSIAKEDEFFKYFGYINLTGLYNTSAKPLMNVTILTSDSDNDVIQIKFTASPEEDVKIGKTNFINLKEFHMDVKKKIISFQSYDKISGDFIPNLYNIVLNMNTKVQNILKNFISEGKFVLNGNGLYYATNFNTVSLDWKKVSSYYNNPTYTLTDFGLNYIPDKELKIIPQETKLNLLTAIAVTDIENDGSVDLNFTFDKQEDNNLPEDNNLTLKPAMKSQLEQILSNVLDEKNKTFYQSFSKVILNWNKIQLKNENDDTVISLLNELNNFNWEKQQFSSSAKQINYIHAEWQPKDTKNNNGWGIHDDRYRIFFKVGEVENPNSEFPLGTEKIFFIYDKNIDSWENMFNLKRLPNQIKSYRQEVKDANFTWEQNNKSLGKDKNLERVAYNISGQKITEPPKKPGGGDGDDKDPGKKPSDGDDDKDKNPKNPNEPNQPIKTTFWEKYWWLILIFSVLGTSGFGFFLYQKHKLSSIQKKSNKRQK